jgi:hypothetical protein
MQWQQKVKRPQIMELRPQVQMRERLEEVAGEVICDARMNAFGKNYLILMRARTFS